MNRRTQENILAVVILCFFIGVLVLSLDYGPRARLVPIPISVLGMILIVAQLIWQNLRPAEELNVDILEFLTKRGRDAEAGDDAGQDPAAPAAAAKAQENSPSFGREVFAFGKVTAFVGLILLLGPIPAAFIFTFAYFSLSRHFHWAKALMYSTLFAVIVYALFVGVLEIQLYNGILEPWVSGY